MRRIKFIGTVGMAVMLAVLMLSGCKKESVAVSGITISSTAETIKIDSTVELSYTVQPEGAKVEKAKWSTSAETVATVDTSGVVKGITEGTATITITVNDKFTATCTVKVEAPIYAEGSYSGKGIKIGNTWWAPVNCGYDATNYKYGKLYQWGRRNGQGYGDSDADYPGKEGGSQTLSSTTAPIASTAEDASVFYKITSSPWDWLTPQDSTRWNSGSESSPSKNTSYDPCPDGWRVPTEAEFSALISQKAWGTNTVGTESQNGYWFNGSSTASVGTGVFLPAAGCRYCVNGTVVGRGSDAIYWSSSVSGYSGRSLNFDSSIAVLLNSDRAGGISVRCVKE